MSEAIKRKYEIGGVKIDTIEAPRPSVVREGASAASIAVAAVKGLVGGMKTTLRYFVHPSSVVTQQYPENRETLKMFDRYRSRLKLIYDEKGHHACTACELCEKSCPNGSIIITKREGPTTKKPELDRFIWRQDSCTFCNICVIVCPFDTLEMTGDFESSVYDRRLLVYNINSYAGPSSKVLNKIEDQEEVARMLEDRAVYSGPMPMCGVALAGVEGLGEAPAAAAPAEVENKVAAAKAGDHE